MLAPGELGGEGPVSAVPTRAGDVRQGAGRGLVLTPVWLCRPLPVWRYVAPQTAHEAAREANGRGVRVTLRAVRLKRPRGGRDEGVPALVGLARQATSAAPTRGRATTEGCTARARLETAPVLLTFR